MYTQRTSPWASSEKYRSQTDSTIKPMKRMEGLVISLGWGSWRNLLLGLGWLLTWFSQTSATWVRWWYSVMSEPLPKFIVTCIRRTVNCWPALTKFLCNKMFLWNLNKQYDGKYWTYNIETLLCQVQWDAAALLDAERTSTASWRSNGGRRRWRKLRARVNDSPLFFWTFPVPCCWFGIKMGLAWS